MIANQVQTQLECLYGIGLEQKVGDYLINKNEALSYINTPAQTTIPKELFLVRRSEEQDTVEVALFLDHTLIDNLSAHNPFESINDTNFSDFCIMIEGVSHFVYYLWKAQQKRNITQLEMELQAEIDKFLMLYFFLRSDKNPVYVQQLFRALFDDFHLVYCFIASFTLLLQLTKNLPRKTRSHRIHPRNPPFLSLRSATKTRKNLVVKIQL